MSVERAATKEKMHFTIDFDAVLRADPFPRTRIVGVCLDQDRLIDRPGRELNRCGSVVPALMGVNFYNSEQTTRLT